MKMCLNPSRCVDPITACVVHAFIRGEDASDILPEETKPVDSTTLVTPKLLAAFKKQEKEAGRL